MCRILLGSRIIYSKTEILPSISFHDGYDNRFNSTIDLDDEKIRSICESYIKFDLLKKLEDPKVSAYEKIKMIEKNYLFDNSIIPNIENGDLYKDWNFVF